MSETQNSHVKLEPISSTSSSSTQEAKHIKSQTVSVEDFLNSDKQANTSQKIKTEKNKSFSNTSSIAQPLNAQAAVESKPKKENFKSSFRFFQCL